MKLKAWTEIWLKETGKSDKVLVSEGLEASDGLGSLQRR